MSHFTQVVGGAFKFSDGHEMPKVGLGISRIPTQEALDTSVEAALKSGYRLFDTANLYKNEHYLGNSLKKYLPVFGLTREDVFITTKVRTLNDNTIEETEKQLANSLSQLQTDYIDLLLIHYPRDRDTGNDDDFEINKSRRKIVWQTLEKAKESGKVRSIGVSNYEVYHLIEMFEYAKVRPVLNQYEYQPYLTRPTLKKFCDLNNIVVQSYSSLCWGDKEILQEEPIVQLCQKYNQTPQAILYAFAYCSNTSMIPKSATPSRIHDNLHNTISIQLTDEELKSLRALDKGKSFPPIGQTWRCL
uniref:Aldo_ket_red domain-containing protein n=1 Tax=Caenorhabditis tropicalis TaxID=1561998 RepID=A0A1I7T4J2_9PELO